MHGGEQKPARRATAADAWWADVVVASTLSGCVCMDALSVQAAVPHRSTGSRRGRVSGAPRERGR